MDRSEPDWSNTIEMLLRKGVKAYKSSSTSWFDGYILVHNVE
jgi:hypothetical protein